MNTLAKKKKFVKDRMKVTTDKVVKAVEAMPEAWDEVELSAYISLLLQHPEVNHELRGNTVRGKAFAKAISSKALAV